MRQKWIWLLSLNSALVGCSEMTALNQQIFDFIPATNVTTKKESLNIPFPKVAATLGYQRDPHVLKAYRKYLKSGAMPAVHGAGFDTLAYDPHSRPIVSCAPMHLCIVQLQKNEKINNIEIGDAAHWAVHTSLIGKKSAGSMQIAIKPSKFRLATDMVVTTDKRSYHIALVSRKGSATQIINFYYPRETFENSNNKVSKWITGDVALAQSKKAKLDVSQLNFNYHMSRSAVAWRPERVFDDGNKTYIQMPERASKYNLPVLTIWHNGSTRLVNYRYLRPYFVIDGLFKRALLISGRGKQQEKLIIENMSLS